MAPTGSRSVALMREPYLLIPGAESQAESWAVLGIDALGDAAERELGWHGHDRFLSGSSEWGRSGRSDLRDG